MTAKTFMWFYGVIMPWSVIFIANAMIVLTTWEETGKWFTFYKRGATPKERRESVVMYGILGLFFLATTAQIVYLIWFA